MKKSTAYQPELIESLRNPREAEDYLNVALEEDPALFLLALRNVTEAQGSVAWLAEKTKLNHESLYKMLSELGNPEFKSLELLLHALGFRLAVAANRCPAAGFKFSEETCALNQKTISAVYLEASFSITARAG